MPFKFERLKAGEAFAREQALVREHWGVEDIHHFFPGLVVRVGEGGIEVTPVLKSEDGVNTVVLFGSTAGEYLKIFGHGLGMGRGSLAADRRRLVNTDLGSIWMSAVKVGGGDGVETRRRDEMKRIGELLGGTNEDDVRYLFDSVPIHPAVGEERRVYFVNFFDGGAEDPPLLKTFAFLLGLEESGIVLGGTVKAEEAS